ncbi:MAG: cytochrome P450 [Amphiplicatus sp.]
MNDTGTKGVKGLTDQEVTELARNFDVHDPRFAKCPYFSVLARMRKQGDVLREESYGGYWAVVSHAAVQQAARDWRSFTSTKGGVLGNDKPQTFIPSDLDPPEHSRFRRILNPFFTRDEAKKLEPKIEPLADSLIDGFIKDGRADLTARYATPISNMVFFDHLFNFTREEAEYCSKAASDGMFAHDPAVRADGFRRVEQFAKNLVTERRGKPSDGGFIDTVRTASLSGRPVTDEEAVNCIQLMIIAGGDTAIAAMGAMFEVIDRHPHVRKQLLDDPTLIPQAFDEMIRFQAPSVAIQREVVQDMEFFGKQFQKGDKIFLLWGSADRDEKVFENPDEFILGRPNINTQVAFGAGPHKCLGEWYARTIVGAATKKLLERIPDFEIEPGAEIEYMMGQTRGPLSLPVIFKPR